MTALVGLSSQADQSHYLMFALTRGSDGSVIEAQGENCVGGRTKQVRSSLPKCWHRCELGNGTTVQLQPSWLKHCGALAAQLRLKLATAAPPARNV